MSITGTPLEISTDDGTAQAYLAGPSDTAGPGAPGVLMFMDAFGLRPQLERMVERIAGWGYLVLAPNVFYRNGTAAELAPSEDLRAPGVREAFFRRITPVMNAHTAARAARDLPAYLGALREQPALRPGPIATIGYCMGGRLALRAAAQEPEQVAAVGMFHVGGLVTDAEDSPHRCIPQVRAEVLAGYADNDRSMDPTAIATVDRALADAGIVHDTSIRPDAPHGYTMADTSSYYEPAAEWHYTRLRDLLDRTFPPSQG